MVTEKPPQTVPELIDAFGGPTDFAKVIDKNPSTASEMKRNGAIRVNYWPLIVEAASKKDIPGVTLETIAQMHLATLADHGVDVPLAPAKAGSDGQVAK